jgi:hypothetical protein
MVSSQMFRIPSEINVEIKNEFPSDPNPSKACFCAAYVVDFTPIRKSEIMAIKDLVVFEIPRESV